ncbi:FimV/HubP family polar landmark protein [Roseateles koreensis]|uniref:LysM domain-containing protein n=1 Tax=Roseateles koreensis TaxID=2987526 RepID=A0ABT5KUU9_9BURK|nr:FimV/HubP family polar landmark protein [Roseateles koreensis]MDC8786220.1 hypothetical protein [Roseateles koreensis]
MLLLSAQAGAVGLGRLSVQSALGETLKAEIDITSLSAEEASTLKVRVAPPDAYRATGVEYNSLLNGTTVQVTRRDGRTFLRVSGDRAVQEPFVDVILELTWASGRLVREYTLLFDPPVSNRPAPVQTTPAIVAAAPVPAPTPALAEPVATPVPAAPASLPPVNAKASPPPSTASASAPSRPKAEAKTEPRPEVKVETKAEPKPQGEAAQRTQAASEYRVKPGDILYRIAVKTQPSGISLDQMLVGLYRGNPDAFVDGNMNRLKTGAVLQVPSAETLGGLSANEARQVIRAQSMDFNAYRQRLGSAAPALKQEQDERQAKGQVQAAVEDKKPAANVAPDKLTLSKAASAADAQKAANAKVAQASKETEKKDSAARVAELTRNVEELKKLSSAAKPVSASTPVPQDPKVVAAPAPASTPAPVTAASSALPTAAVAGLPAVPASALPQTVAKEPAAASTPASAVRRVAAASAPAAIAPTTEKPEPSFLDSLLESSLLLPLGGGVAAALGAFGLYRLRGRRGSGKPDTGFHESRAQPDSFFGATGGARVDTRDASSGGSSMNYSLSQLDAIGDVDPVAEADVYLAYGRDLQAEEILKEALRANPERLAIRLKLLEVYAKRRDTKGFEQLAIQLYAETHGQGDDWAKAQELGRQIDPENPLYQPGGAPLPLDDGRDVHPEPMDASTMPHTVSAGTGEHLATEPLMARSEPAPEPLMSGFDLDLDLDLDGSAGKVTPSALEATQAMAVSVEHAPLSMDFDLSEPVPAASKAGSDLEFDLDLPDLDAPADASTPATSAHEGSLDFDLSSIDLSLPSDGAAVAEHVPPIPAAESSSFDGELPAEFAAMLDKPVAPAGEPLGDIDALADDGGDPLMRQLELADEFRQIGDTEGAREVLQELVGKASGPLRDQAQAMLNELR